MENKRSVFINSVSRAIDILLYLSASESPVTITEIANSLNLYKSTVFRMLTTLEYKGFVSQDKETEKYTLGPKLYIVAASMNTTWSLIQFIKPYAQSLSKKFNETINVSVLEEAPDKTYRGVIVYQENSSRAINANTRIGSHRDCYSSSVGKCLLAFSDNINLTVYNNNMVKSAPNTITTFEDLKKEIHKVKMAGYAIDDEEGDPDLFCIGIPIIINGCTVASMSISGPIQRMKNAGLNEKIKEMLIVSKNIQNDTAH